ncbi:hypothetical protein ACFLUU_00255 [Chloroflexota bacterium]
MKNLQGLALGLLSLFLFLSLSIFSLAFMLNSTTLNPKFVTSELDRFDVSSLAGELVSMQTPQGESPEEFETALVNTITELEPLVKEQLSATIYPIYDYLKGKNQSIDLKLTLRNTFLNSDFVVSLIDELNLSSLAAGFLGEQFTEQIPEEMEFLTEHLDDAIAELEPTIKEELIAAADPVVDYLLGESRSLSVVISLEPVLVNLEDNLKEAFVESPPAELADLPQSTLNQLFEEYFEEVEEMIPSTFEIDETLIGTEIPTQITERLAEAEDGLEEAKQYVGYFQLGYKLLIGFMLLLILGIILISREVKDITRRLGIPCLTYGALWYAGTFIGKYFSGKYLTGTMLPLVEIPPSLQTWLPQFVANFLAPLQMFSLGLLVCGIVLIIVSFAYPRWRQSKL